MITSSMKPTPTINLFSQLKSPNYETTNKMPQYRNGQAVHYKPVGGTSPPISNFNLDSS